MPRHATPRYAMLCHVMPCHACAGTSLTYAEWAPLAPLTDSGLIRACAYFLTTQDFRLLACDILKQLSHRRQEKVRRPLQCIPTSQRLQLLWRSPCLFLS